MWGRRGYIRDAVVSSESEVWFGNTAPHPRTPAGAIFKALLDIQGFLLLDCLSEPVGRLSPAFGQGDVFIWTYAM